jgi:hypothetical protein
MPMLTVFLQFAQLSPRTFWNFAREFSSFRRQRDGYGRAALISDTVLPVYSGARAIRLCRAVASSPHGPAGPLVGCR